MSEFQKNLLLENATDKTNPTELRNGLYRLIQNHNPLITEMYERADYVRKNEARKMTEDIQTGDLNNKLYEQMLVATTIVEGIISWGTQEIKGQIEASLKQINFNSEKLHSTYIQNQTNRYSLFGGDTKIAKLKALSALNRFPARPIHYIDFFGEHAIFCVTQSLVGHSAVNDILQPLSHNCSSDESLELLIKNQPVTLEQLFDAELYLKDIQESEL